MFEWSATLPISGARTLSTSSFAAQVTVRSNSNIVVAQSPRGGLGIGISLPQWVSEALLASYLLTSAYKGLTLGWPVDITLLTGVLTAGAALYRTRKAGWSGPRPIVWMLAIFAILAVPLVAAPTNAYGAEKATRFYTIVAIAALAPPSLFEVRLTCRGS